MGTLKYALLGLLNQKSLTGYDLMKEFETTVSEFWYAKHSQIYPELKKLTDDGLVEFKVETVGSAMQKKVYSITGKGREEFLDWMLEKCPLEHTPKSEFRLRVFFSSALEPQARLVLLQEQLEKYRGRLKHLQSNFEKFPQVPPQGSDAFGDYMVLMGAIMRDEYICNWLAKCIDLCKNAE